MGLTHNRQFWLNAAADPQPNGLRHPGCFRRSPTPSTECPSTNPDKNTLSKLQCFSLMVLNTSKQHCQELTTDFRYGTTELGSVSNSFFKSRSDKCGRFRTTSATMNMEQSKIDRRQRATGLYRSSDRPYGVPVRPGPHSPALRRGGDCRRTRLATERDAPPVGPARSRDIGPRLARALLVPLPLQSSYLHITPESVTRYGHRSIHRRNRRAHRRG